MKGRKQNEKGTKWLKGGSERFSYLNVLSFNLVLAVVEYMWMEQLIKFPNTSVPLMAKLDGGINLVDVCIIEGVLMYFD